MISRMAMASSASVLIRSRPNFATLQLFVGDPLAELPAIFLKRLAVGGNLDDPCVDGIAAVSLPRENRYRSHRDRLGEDQA